MINASVKGANGRDLLLIGLSFGNLDQFRALPGDTYIRVDGGKLGLSMDVMIFSGETEAHCVETLSEFTDSTTKVYISDRLKQ